ncbi:type III pantothenate kinase [Marinigracilibium pacificum]|uniref:Type III pantothenate kinase n=1 Tax=Marinigracilibium pacificum TaxID=2729599 RepID=A0A848IUJ4_9BACT|nr:type III pantothenate kinase [Marinigracilibium pacificum]NMM48173.1 type III pantothenate kinase [Marinigracilibium pacificum]
MKTLLSIDIGNSDIVVGLWRDDKIEHIWRTPSSKEKNPDAFQMIFRQWLLESDIKISEITSISLSSVVPILTDKVSSSMEALFGISPLIIGPEVYNKIPISTERPTEIGSDLMCNALSAYIRSGRQACVVVDFGTALTFTSVNNDGSVAGVAIAPGLKTAIKALTQNTAKLPEVPLEMPKSVLGKNTVHAIQAGILGGYTGLVEKMISLIKQELDTSIHVYATGGLSSILTPLNDSFDIVDVNLTLDGLRLMHYFYEK